MLNQWISSPLLDPVMVMFTHLGDMIVWVAIGALMIALKKTRILGLFLLWGLVIDGLIVYTLKLCIGRVAPYGLLANVRLLVDRGPEAMSMPSGHSSRVFMASTVIGSKVKWKLRGALYTMACLVAISRVYVGVHWPSDVLLGAIVGIIVGKIVIRLR